MAAKVTSTITYKNLRSIEPIYTGGAVAANKDGSLLATCVDDDVLLVDLRTSRVLLRVDGDGEAATSLALTPDASYMVVCSRSLSMRIFALTSNGSIMHAELSRTLKPHNSPVISSSVDETGTLLATGAADGITKVWDIRGGYCSHVFHGHGGLVTAVELFNSATKNHNRKLGSTKSIKKRSTSSASTGEALTGATILLAAGGEDGKIKVWDLNTKINVASLESHFSVVKTIKHSLVQKSLLSLSRDKTIIIWDTETWQSRRIIPALEVLESGGFLFDGKLCYGGGDHGKLRVWSTEDGREITRKQQSGLETETIVATVQVSAEDAILTIHQDQSMVLHSYSTIQAFNGDQPRQGTVTTLPLLRRISGNHDEIIDMACIGPSKSLLALATNTESVKIISIQDHNVPTSAPAFGSDVALLQGHENIIICLAVDWSGHWLATGAKDNTAKLWRLDPKESSFFCFATFAGHAESIGAIALPQAVPTDPLASKHPLNHPPSYLLTGSQDKTIKKWDTSKLSMIKPNDDPPLVAKSVYTRVAHEKDINSLDVSAFAPIFASASQDKTIKVWSTEDGSTTGILRGHRRGVWSVKFSPAGMAPISLSDGGKTSSRGVLISGSGDRTVKVWSLSTYTCLLTFEGHSNSILKVIWVSAPGFNRENDNQRSQGQAHNQNQPIIASASSDTLVKLWNPYAAQDSDHLLTTLDNHSDRVWSLASPHPAIPNHGESGKPQSHIESSYAFLSGAADASITFWTDTTTETALASSKAMTERIEQDQLLQNHMHSRNYRESIVLSLKLNHPARLLKILSDIINLPESEKEHGSLTGVLAVDDVLGSLSQEELYLLLERIRDWNVNARTAPIAQRVLNVLFKKYPTSLWTEMAQNRSLGRTLRSNDTISASATGKPMSMRDLFRALEVYTEKHYRRIEELVDESYMIEYTLREMDEVAGTVQVNEETMNVVDEVMVNGGKN